MHIRGQAPILWCAQGTSQVGVRGRGVAVLTDLSTDEQSFLARLPDHLSQEVIYRTARAAGVPLSAAQHLISRVEDAGVILRDRPSPIGPQARCWERAGMDAGALQGRLRSASVAVLGSGAVCAAIACLIAQCGVGTVVCEEPQAAMQLRSQFPHVRTGQELAGTCELVVHVCPYVIDPVRERSLTQNDVPHLPVVLCDTGVLVGPLLDSRTGLCRACLDLWMCEEQPHWPAVATQARLLPPPDLDALTCNQAAVCAARAVTEILAEQVTGMSLPWREQQAEVIVGRTQVGFLHCSAHPQCLCAALPAPPQGGVAESTQPSCVP